MIRRDAFQYPDHAYFLSHSVGVQPKIADNQLSKMYLEPWRAARGDAWDYWLQALDDFKSELAKLIEADARDVCPQTNVSSALSKITFSLPERSGRKKIVLTSEDFPTIGHVFKQAERMGYELVFIKGGDALASMEHWADALDESVQLLHITQIFSNRSVRPPVQTIVKRARALGIYSVVDVAQGAGAVPVNATVWNADFVTGTSVKYLCGGPGAAFLWANPDTVQSFLPMDAGWFSQDAPFPADIDRFEFATNATRFLGGTPSVAPFAIAAASLRLLNEIGVERIFAHNQSLLDRLIVAVPRQAIASHIDAGARGSSIILKPGDVSTASERLMRAGFIHDQRMGGLRFSAHVYNSEDEIDALAAALAPLI